MILKTLDNAIQVINCFTKERNSWGVRELARELGVSHTAINRILKTFEKNGYLIQDTETKKYHLGLKFLELSQIVSENFSVIDKIKPIMKEITEQTGESIFLTWREQYDGVTLAIVESSESIKYSVSIGTRTPLYVGASCKVMMAFLPKEEQQEIIDQGLTQFTKNTTTNEEKLKEELQIIKDQNWSYTCGEYSDDVFGLGVPIFDQDGNIIASITIAGPEYRLTKNKKQQMLNVLLSRKTHIQRIISNFN